MILDCLAVADFNLLGKRLRAERLGVIGGSLGNAPSFVAKRANQRRQQLLVTIPRKDAAHAVLNDAVKQGSLTAQTHRPEAIAST